LLRRRLQNPRVGAEAKLSPKRKKMRDMAILAASGVTFGGTAVRMPASAGG
jgi:hypothetical protein